MVVPPVLQHDVIQAIKSLQNKKGNINELPVHLFKENKEIFSIPLSILFNQSVETGKFPTKFKHATVIPIFKKGNREEIGNYRPISLLNIFSKVFEKLMKNNLLNFLSKKAIIIPEQYGFRQGLSTFDALHVFSEKIYKTLDEKKSLLSIYIDFSKAFDTVKHDILLSKLQHYGIRGIINDWFRDYLTNRTQSTKISDKFSSPQHIQYGVPQGSALGPLLFLLYVNDIANIFENTKSILFADDATLYTTGENLRDLIYTANTDLHTFHTWCVSNRLTVNFNKTFYMLFTNKPYTFIPPLFIGNNTIKQTNQHTLLGVTFDDKLTFKQHISNLILKLSRIVSLLYQVREVMPIYVLKTLYNAHILPHLYYCTSVWCSTYPTHLLPLFRLQKKVIRIITNSDFFEHTQHLFKETNILKLFDINKVQTATQMFKVLKNQSDPTFTELQHNYPTRTRDLLRISQHSLTIFQHSFSFMGPKIWNSIPIEIKNKPNPKLFSKHYKKYLLTQY